MNKFAIVPHSIGMDFTEWCMLVFPDEEIYEEIHQLINENNITHTCDKDTLTLNVNYIELLEYFFYESKG